MVMATAVRDQKSSPGEVMDPSDPAHVASYIEEMTAELVPMAQSGGMDFLAYLLELARMEAQTRANEPIIDENG